jgi:hypothetical protein
MKQSPERPPEQSSSVVLSVSVIADGKYFRAGEATPFTEATLPDHLKEYISTGDEEPPFSPAERELYSPALMHEVRRIKGNIELQSWCEEEANKPLPEDVREVLEDKHSRHVGLARAQMQSAQNLTDSIYAESERVSEPQRFFVKRGAVYVDVRKVTPKPAEHVFARRLNGEYETIGIVDSEGQLPDEEIIP